MARFTPCAVVVVVSLLANSSCQTSRPISNMFGSSPPVLVENLALLSANPGPGHNVEDIYINSHGKLWVRTANLGDRTESRYLLNLDAADLTKLTQTIEEHDFLTLTLPFTEGYTDEPWLRLAVKFANGSERVVGKWAAHSEKDFDAIAAFVENFAERAKANEPVFAGPLDLEWQPPDMSLKIMQR